MNMKQMQALLTPYKVLIEKKIQESLERLTDRNRLREACDYALTNGGKRFRPALVLMVANALNRGLDASEAALAVELFHTASLVADDLPCMDNDDQRRDKPALHKVYGEAITLLVSYALIAAGYECLARNAELIRGSKTPYAGNSDRICVLAVENASYNTGFFGATGGQFIDIFPPNLELSTLRDLIQKKTVSLFEISFVFGWLFGGGAIEQLPLLKQAAGHFGMAFQIADDLEDMEQDLKNERAINLAAVMGVEAATKMFHEEIAACRSTLAQLGLASKELIALADMLVARTTTAT
jgi:geranylgeranyl diphosphate synthase type II